MPTDKISREDTSYPRDNKLFVVLVQITDFLFSRY